MPAVPPSQKARIPLKSSLRPPPNRMPSRPLYRYQNLPTSSVNHGTKPFFMYSMCNIILCVCSREMLAYQKQNTVQTSGKVNIFPEATHGCPTPCPRWSIFQTVQTAVTHSIAQFNTLPISLSCTLGKIHTKQLNTQIKTTKYTNNKGEFLAIQKGNVCASSWMDRKVVTVISTTSQPESTNVLRHQKDGSRISVPCPMSVMDYNTYMGGIDRGDQVRG